MENLDSKICNNCHKTKQLVDFGVKNGKRTSTCKECLAAKHREYYAAHKEIVKHSVQQYYEKNREQILAKGKAKRDQIKAEKEALKPKIPDGFRICRECKKLKPLDDFHKNGSVYRHTCKECKNKYAHEQYLRTKDKVLARTKQYNFDHAEERKQWRLEHRDYLKEQHRKWHQENIEYVIQYRNVNKKHIAKTQKEYRLKNKEKLAILKRQYLDKHPHYYTEYEKKRIITDPLYKFKKQIRCMIYGSFYRKSFGKSKHTQEIIGCDLDTFINHLLKTYKKNYGVDWNMNDPVHIDHIVPLASAKSKKEIERLCHYTNLQLLKPVDNLLKSDKIV